MRPAKVVKLPTVVRHSRAPGWLDRVIRPAFEELIDQTSSSNEEMKPIFPHRKFWLAVILVATALIILLGNGAMAMTLNSPAFKHNGHIPSKYTCEGDDVSPPLAWEGVPDGAKSLVLIIDDPDAPDPKAPKMVWVHWIVYNMPPGHQEPARERKRGAVAARRFAWAQ